MTKYTINDKYVKIRKVNNEWKAIHLFTEKVLYDETKNYIDKNLSDYTIKRIKQTIKELKTFEKEG